MVCSSNGIPALLITRDTLSKRRHPRPLRLRAGQFALTFAGMWTVRGNATHPFRQPLVLSPGAAGSTTYLPACTDQTAYVSLVTNHGRGNSTRLSRSSNIDHVNFKMLSVLVHSIRRNERQCRRNFTLLMGERVRIPPENQNGLLRDEVSLHVVPPIRLGVPSMDKLHAWTLPHSYVVFIDADALVLQPLDTLFESSSRAGLTIGQHAYDLVQGKRCGIPVGKRGVGAFLGFRPDRSAFKGLMQHLSTYDAAHLNHYSEQTAVACYYHTQQQLHTLPCATFYDTTVERNTRTRFDLGEHPSMHQGFGSCLEWGGVPRKECARISDHIRGACMWKSVHASVLAVHFKGKTKPWYHVARVCSPILDGRLSLLTSTAWLGANATGLDDLHWKGSRSDGACMSRRHRLAVAWAARPGRAGGRAVPVPKRCCLPNTALAAEWNELLAEVLRLDRDKRSSGAAV